MQDQSEVDEIHSAIKEKPQLSTQEFWITLNMICSLKSPARIFGPENRAALTSGKTDRIADVFEHNNNSNSDFND